MCLISIKLKFQLIDIFIICNIYLQVSFEFKFHSYIFVIVCSFISNTDLNSSHSYLNWTQIISPKIQKFHKGHVEIYRTPVDDLNQFHQHERNIDLFDMFCLKARKLSGFSCMNAMHTSTSSLFVDSNSWDVT